MPLDITIRIEEWCYCCSSSQRNLPHRAKPHTSQQVQGNQFEQNQSYILYCYRYSKIYLIPLLFSVVYTGQ